MNDLTQVITQHQAEAEKLFAGAAMLSPEHVREACGWLAPEVIQDPRIARYWQSVKNGCEPSEAAMEAGIYYEVAGYMTKVVSQFEATAFAKTIGQDRYLFYAASTLSDMARAISDRDMEVLQKLAQSIIDNTPNHENRLPTAADIGLEFQATLGNMGRLLVPTGIAPLDKNMGGYERSTLVIVAGRPGMGKTAFGLQSASEVAKAGLRVIYFSLEMSKRDLWARLACGRSGVDWQKIKAEAATEEEYQKVTDASVDLIDELDNRLIIDDRAMNTSEDIYRRVAQYKPDLIVVDHLDLLDRHLRGKLNEVTRVGNISRMGKVIAKTFDIPAVYLMQLNRATEGREDKRPVLSDLRASGEVEQDADVVGMLYRPDYYDRDKQKENVVYCEIWLEKVRNGQAGVRAKTMLHLQEQHFYPLSYFGMQDEYSPIQKPAQPKQTQPKHPRRKQSQNTPPEEPEWQDMGDLEL